MPDEVAYSKTQLEAAKSVLDTRAAEIVKGGIPLAGWWIDIPNNALKVQVVNPTSLDAVRNDLARYVGDTPLELEVVPDRMIQESRPVDPAPCRSGR
jgi:alpha-lytic protease prodomain-containing protein